MAKKTKDKDVDEGKPFKKEVLCKFSRDAREKKLERIAAALGEIKSEEAAAKVATSGHRTRINEKKREVEGLRSDLESGKELRMVNVVEHKDYRANVVKILRVDTREVVETREMTTEERQTVMPDVPRKPAGKAKLRALPPVPTTGEAIAAARADEDGAPTAEA